jgi:hypothetical protein
MAWTNLAILGVGGLLVSIPVLLHLLMQPKPQILDFPALRFLKERNVVNQTRMRFRHLLLLLLRCLLIALVALALAGPMVASADFGNWVTMGGIGFLGLILAVVFLANWFSSNRNSLLLGIVGAILALVMCFGAWSAYQLFSTEGGGAILGDSGAPVAAIIVMDSSPTMEYQLQNQARFEEAKETADWLINQLPSDSQVCVAATDNDIPFFSVDVSAAKRRVETLEVSYNADSIGNTLAKAIPLLEKNPLERKEVYVVTDLTRKGWATDTQEPALTRLSKDESVSIFVIDVGVADPSNFSLGRIELSDSRITSNGELTIRSSVARLGEAAQRTIRLKIEKQDLTRPVVRDGKSLLPESFWEQTTLVDIRQDSTTEFSFKFSDNLATGTYHGVVEVVGADGLAVDDQKYFSFEVSQPWQTLVVHPSDVNPQFLLSCISPSSAALNGQAAFVCKVIEQHELKSIDNLKDFQAVFLLDPKPLQPAQWESLAQFADNGGGVGIFLGHNASSRGVADTSFKSESAQKVLGGELTFPYRRPDGDLFLSPQNLDHSIFTILRKIKEDVPWNRFPVYLHWGLEPATGDENFPTQTVLQFGNLNPAILERKIGNGLSMVMTTPITDPARPKGRSTWNDLTLVDPPPWVAYYLTSQIANHLVQADANFLNLQVGQIGSFRNDLKYFPETYQVFSPDLDKPPANVTTVKRAISYRFVNRPGHYRFRGAFDGPILRGFSANLAPQATDLTRVQPEDIDRVLGAGRYQLATDKDVIERQQGTARRGQEFYPLIMMLMFVALALEYLVSNLFYRS